MESVKGRMLKAEEKNKELITRELPHIRLSAGFSTETVAGQKGSGKIYSKPPKGKIYSLGYCT